MTISVDGEASQATEEAEEKTVCYPDARKKNTVVVLSSSTMGNGDDELGAILMKGFIYALSQQEELPTTILCTMAAPKFPVRNLRHWKI